MSERFIGLMSGTSLDGVDGVVVDFVDGEGPMSVLAHAHRALSPALRAELLALNTAGPNELERSALAGNGLAGVYAEVVRDLLSASGVPATQIRAIGAHGQTVRHRPGEFDGTGFTVQINNPALLAERCGIDVIADFRSRDVAAGGQGAPLVPAFHRAVFGHPTETIGVLNLGGIANLTVLASGGQTSGFDCGPANVLMDLWCERHIGRAFDHAGEWAASGQIQPQLLTAFLSDPYFTLPPPKSTGRDLFNPGWLDRHVTGLISVRPEDVQATLCELTARACAEAVQRYERPVSRLLVCGGGALNTHLMKRLAVLLPHMSVGATNAVGLPVLQVEAAAFAWLARAFTLRQPGNLSAVTGATGPRVLGALYPA
jgi:anhydro-N-acetylmuramic acid kinase